MKTVLTPILLLVCLCAGNAKAQSTVRLRLFDNFSQKINCTISSLDNLFSSKSGDQITIPFQGVSFTGAVMSNTKKYENLTSMVIKLNNLDATAFGISRITNKDKSYSYTGRILNQKYADMFLLVKDAAGNYSLEKQQTDEMIQDHN